MRRRGFTLLEVMMVLVVAGILLTLGVAQFRRMQDNTSFNMEAQHVAGELRSLAAEARSVGQSPTAVAGSGSGTLTSTGRFQWRVYRNNRIIKEGLIGKVQDITITYTATMQARTAGTVGVWLQVNRLAPPGAPQAVLQVIFRPDGTPLDAGEILLRNRSHGQRITVTSQGSVEGPRAE